MTHEYDTGNSIADSLLVISTQLDPLVDMVAGYRAKLELAGYSPTTAEAMSADLHGQMLARMLAE